MLRSLYIKNYAIIDELNIDFSKGFNVFTGETGAGKSIIVGALSYLIHGKADSSIIKSNEVKAIIEGVFDIEDYMKEKLKDADIDFDDELIIRRTISNDGHNSIKVNNCNVTLNYLVDLLNDHIDIHSQKDNQFLLNKKNHLSLLDKYSKIDDLLCKYKIQYSKYYQLLQEYNNLLNNTYNENDIEFIKFNLNELLDAKLDVNEENDLIEKEKRFKSQEKYLTILNNSLSLYENDGGIKDSIKMLIKELNINDDDINIIKESINNSYYAINDEIDKLKNILNSFSDDNLNIEKIEERLYLYSKLKRKHNTDVLGLVNIQNDLKDKLKLFENKNIVLKEKTEELNKNKELCLSLASKIHSIRTDKAKQLEKDVIKQTNDLMLNNVNFKINIDEVELNNNGIDNVEFYISLNKGESLKPLKDIASGGEISRLMLALKTIFTSLSDCFLVIFDEIDTGVSGKVALSIGEKIKTISSSCQVLTITHLAPVAACANNHYYIYKENSKTSTNTKVKELNKDEIIKELALISSTEVNDKSLAAAKELYKIAQESK